MLPALRTFRHPSHLESPTMCPLRRAFLAAIGPSAVAAGSASPSSIGDTAGDAVAQVRMLAALAHESLMRGDLARYRTQVALTDDFTLMAPFGGVPHRHGDYTDEQWTAIGRFFRNGRRSTLEVIRAYPSTDLVVLAAIERSHVEVGGLPAQDWGLRVTLVFRKEGDRWALAHRHADPLAGGISVAESAALARRSEAPGNGS